jgi:predicted MFS family arabinose efflux permease
VTYEGEIPARASSAAAKSRGSYRLMVAPVFGPFFWGKILAASGLWIHNIVAAVVTYEVSGSAFVVGLVSVAQFTPQLLFAPLSGKLADRGNAAMQIVLGRMLAGAGSAGLAAWIWLAGGVDGLPNAAPVLASSLVVGLGLVLGGPALQSIVPTMIRPGEMAAAMALNSVPMILGRAGGPALGTLLATQLGAAEAFAAAAVVNILFGLIVLALRLPSGRTEVDTDFSVRASLRHLRSDRTLFVLLIAVASVAIGTEPSLTLAPALASDLGGRAGLVGWLASAFGIGAGLGFVLFAPLHRRMTLPWLTHAGLLLMASGMMIAAAGRVASVALVAFGLAGVGMTLALTSITTQIQDRSPDALRGRIMALWMVGFLGARPFAAVLDGYVADAVSVDAALLLTGAVVLATAYVCRPSRLSAGPLLVARPPQRPVS